MHGMKVTLSAIAIATFGAVAAAQADPEITAPAILPLSENDGLLPMSDNETSWWNTRQLTPEDEDYVDEAEAAKLAKRGGVPSVFMCPKTDWKGNCLSLNLKDYQCVQYTWSMAASFGPPQGWQCKLFWSKGCVPGTGNDGKLTYPGTPNLGLMYNKAPNDAPGSFMCRECSDAYGFKGSCLNNNAPDFYLAQAKVLYGGAKNTCTKWVGGVGTTHYPCLPAATVDPHFKK